jgi:endonuclease YncB( thermonuclease family)
MMTRARSSFSSLLLAALALTLPIRLPAQSVAATPEAPWAPVPSEGPCPSVVPFPTSSSELCLGQFRLSRELPPVVDGDTIRVEGLDRTLRLIGIDTEETFKDPGHQQLARRDWPEYLRTVNAGHRASRPPKYGTPMGEAARRFAEHFFAGKRIVRLEYDDPGRRRGYYGRHLVHVLARHEGRWVNFNVEIVRQGLSPYFVKYGRSRRYDAAFREAEREARGAARGVWAPKPAWPCYPDYPIRLLWWQERDRDLRTVEHMAETDPSLVVLGDDAAWSRLRALAGQKVTVAATPGRVRHERKLSFQHLSHQNRKDLLIVGSPEEIAALGIEEQDGNYLLVTGTVSLHRGQPQFRADTVTWRRVPPPPQK